jgi:hypothetical protein
MGECFHSGRGRHPQGHRPVSIELPSAVAHNTWNLDRLKPLHGAWRGGGPIRARVEHDSRLFSPEIRLSLNNWDWPIEHPVLDRMRQSLGRGLKEHAWKSTPPARADAQ